MIIIKKNEVLTEISLIRSLHVRFTDLGFDATDDGGAAQPDHGAGVCGGDGSGCDQSFPESVEHSAVGADAVLEESAHVLMRLYSVEDFEALWGVDGGH